MIKKYTIFVKSSCLLLLAGLFTVSSYTIATAQTYVQATSFTTSTYGNETVTVSTSGPVYNFTLCGSTGPFFIWNGGSSVTWAFSHPVASIRVPLVFAGYGPSQSAHFTVNGSSYTLTAANMKGGAGGCSDGVNAVIVGGDITNTGDEPHFPSQIIYIPGPITSVTVQNNGGATNAAVAVPMFFEIPSFDNGATQSLNVCQNASATSTNAKLTASGGTGTYGWSVVTSPAHGSLSGFSASASAGSHIAPSGTSYTPTTGYSGSDQYVIRISDGTNSSDMTMNVTVTPIPNTISGTSSPICMLANTTFSNSAAGGIWTSNASSVATVNGASGVVTGVAGGTTTITYSTGCVPNATKSIVVNPTATVNAVANQIVCNGANTTAINFTSPTTGGTIVYNWTNNTPSIGLAASGSGNIASFVGTNTTNAPVTATITVTPNYTNGGTTCTGTPTTSTIIVNPTPTVNTIANQAICNNAATSAITFSGAVTGTVYNWTNNTPSIGLAASGTGNIASFTATNTTAATVIATITVTPNYTNSGVTCVGTPTTFTITVNPKPAVSFTVNTTNQCLNPNSYVFTSTSTVSSGTMTYAWNFGDGTTATGATPAAHAYSTAGAYTVKLVVTTNNGCKDSTTQTITIYPKPNVSFTVNTANQCLNPNSYVFASTSTISSGTMTYAWDLGDGTTATGTTPAAHTYATAGTYSVKLVVTTNNGCKDSTTQTVTVYPKPVVGFTVNTASQCLNPNSYTFTSTSTVSSGTLTYAWYLGDGTTATGSAPAAHTYTTAGTYPVKLVVTTNNGCKDSTTQTVTIYPKPIVAFTVNNANQCLNANSYTFTSTSTVSSGTLTAYTWNFGDGTTATGPTPAAHTYATAGAYTVKLVVTTDNGCKDSTTQSITVYPKPAVAFTVNTTNQCLNPNSYTFTSTSTISSGTITTYAWDLGDGTTATGSAPAVHTYATAGTYPVKLVVTTNNGCKDSTTQTVTVYPKPIVTFTVNTTNQCLNPNSYTFISTATVSSGTLTAYTWDLGDGTTATGPTPAAHTYTTAGAYTIKLVVTTDNGCTDSTTQTITIYPKPTASFTINTANQCLNPNSYTFTSTSTVSSGTLTYAWDLGDGTTAIGSAPAAHTYTTAGTYSVKLVVTTNNGCKDSTTQTVTVYPKPIVAFTVNNANQCLNANSYTFTSTSTVSSGTLTTYTWNFGDGTTATGTTPAAHTYTTAGAYTVKLVVTTDNGCMDSTTQTITIYPKPTASFTINTVNQCLNPNSYTFISTATVSSGTLTAYAWDLGDGTTATGSAPAAHTYTTAGTYPVKLVVTTNNGCKDSTTQTVTVYPKPNVAFTVNNANQCLNANSYTFISTATVSSGTLTAYTWNFGDGTMATGTTPAAHTYTTAGAYTVKLVVTTDNGCKDSTTQSITVYPKPAVAFTVNTTNQCLNPNSYTFTSTSTISSGTITAYAWDLGDGTTATGSAPAVHTYATAGTYPVKLVVTTNNGCKDSTTQTVTVYPKPIVAFTVNTTNQCLNPNSYIFISIATVSSGTLTAYTWDLGDGTTATGPTPAAHTYTTAGVYTIKLVVTTDNGCTDSTTQTITIYPKPTVSFTINTVNQCLNPNSYTFTSTSTVSSGTLTYAWDLGDGTTATGSAPAAHTYATAGTYSVKLIATSNNGCIDSTVQSMTVYPKPTPSFTIAVKDICTHPEYTFTNASNISSGTMTYVWNFGDNNTDVTLSPSHSYATPGTYNVVLVASSNNGCKDSITQQVVLLPNPVASFTITDTAQCINNNNFIFTNTSAAGRLAYAWNFGDGTTATVANPDGHKYITAGKYTVQLTATNDSGCVDTTTQTRTVYPSPTSIIGGNKTICNGMNDTIAVILTGSGPWQLSYSDGSTSETVGPINSSPYTFIVVPTESHTYTITSLSDIHCSANQNDKKGSHSVVVEEFPTVFIDKGDSIFCNGDVAQLTAHGSSDAYRWNTGDNTCCISVNTTGLYTVAITNTCGEAKDSTHLSYGSCDKCLWFPSAFSPNGDGKNDIFHSISYCQVLNYEIQIFNRLGNTIYTSNNPKQGWDGTLNGRPAETGTYVYFVKATYLVDGVNKEVNQKGDVVLIR
jgi:gliding motility-associated-like protein